MITTHQMGYHIVSLSCHMAKAIESLKISPCVASSSSSLGAWASVSWWDCYKNSSSTLTISLSSRSTSIK